jgi:predicted transcriptional regulator
MRKSAVYSWRMEADRKAQLESVARRRKRPLSELLDEAVTQWLKRQSLDSQDEEARARQAAARAFGKVSGGDPERSSQVRSRMRDLLSAKHR